MLEKVLEKVLEKRVCVKKRLSELVAESSSTLSCNHYLIVACIHVSSALCTHQGLLNSQSLLMELIIAILRTEETDLGIPQGNQKGLPFPNGRPKTG